MAIKKQTVIPPGTPITVCPPRRAKGLESQRMRARGGYREPVIPTGEDKHGAPFDDTDLHVVEYGGEG